MSVSVPLNRVSYAEGDGPDGRLFATFNELGVNPFTNDCVQAYKDRMKKQSDDAFNAAQARKGVITRFFAQLAITAIVVFIVTVVPLVMTESTARYILLVEGGVIALSVGAMLMTDRYYHEFGPTKGTWRFTTLEQVRGGAPDWVRSLAEDLRSKHPGIHLEVEEFHQERAPLDPFLFVRTLYGDYYIAVWDEDSFDGPRV